MSSFSLLSPSTWLSKSADKPVAASSSSASPASPAVPTSAPVPLGATSTIAPAPSAGDPTSVTAPATPSSESAKKNIYLKTLKKCFTKPDKTVLKHPIKSTIYHVAIQILFYSVAQSFPVFGSIVIAFSVALFERVVVLNPKKYGNAILKSLRDSWKYITSKWSKAKPAPAASSPPTPVPAPASTPSSSSATPPPVASPAAAPASTPPATPVPTASSSVPAAPLIASVD